MTSDTPLPFDLPAVGSRKLTIDFDAISQSSDAGLLLLREAERRLRIAGRLARVFVDRRDQSRIDHAKGELFGARIFAIAQGYEDANDHDRLRHDPLLKLAVGRAPETGAALASQSTISRLENAPTRTEAARLTAALVDHFGAHVRPGAVEVLDIDDSFYVAHGGQQMTFWNAHADERGFAPMHIFHVASGAPVATILRTGKTPKGTEVATVVKHLTRRLRQSPAWTGVFLIWRGDGHYGRPEAMDWCEANGCGYIFGLAGNSVLDAMTREAADALRLAHAASSEDKLRRYMSFDYQARSWARPRRVVARLEASLQTIKGVIRQEVDVRCIVTTMGGDAQHLYEDVYCRRGQMENLIKLAKTQLATRRTSCHRATANQVRLVLHTAAYWLVHAVRNAVPKAAGLSRAEFATIRARLMKIAARVVERGSRIRVRLPASCPEAAMFRRVALELAPAGS